MVPRGVPTAMTHNRVQSAQEWMRAADTQK